MSAFLGPIHHWLYNKIQIQNEMANLIIEECVSKECQETYRNDVIAKLGEFSVKPLEEIIDENNIHGWLQDKVIYVERKLSMVVTNFAKEDAEAIEKMQACMNKMGETMGRKLSEITSADQAYQMLNDMLLDGMPCDHINQLQSKDDEKVEWIQTRCIHSQYWEEVDGDSKNYYIIRNAFIVGLLSKTPIRYNIAADGHYILVKEN